MTTETLQPPIAGRRGPADHSIREQIVMAAHDHFAHYGYDKTTVSDLARAIGFSKAYIYKFFDSKQAIGEAICKQTLDGLLVQIQEEVAEGRSATDRIRRLFAKMVSASADLFSHDRRLYEIAVHSALEKWPSCVSYCDGLEVILRQIILEGRASGEFERKTALDETCRAILQTMESFFNPIMLRYKLDKLPDAPVEVVSLILRSLAP